MDESARSPAAEQLANVWRGKGTRGIVGYRPRGEALRELVLSRFFRSPHHFCFVAAIGRGTWLRNAQPTDLAAPVKQG
jgi:hypothetical protein